MKLCVIATVSLGFLFLAVAEKSVKHPSEIDNLDILDPVGTNSNDEKSSDAYIKRESGYSYNRPDRFSSGQRHREIVTIRGRIVTKRPSGQTIKPFNQYGPPKFRQPSSGHRLKPQVLGISGNDFSNGQGNGQEQEVPSPIRQYDFVEPSPIAGQNNEPFNSNAANYLPPRNQKLPLYSSPFVFSNQQQQSFRDSNAQQTFNNNHQSQGLLQGPTNNPQISDAALFLTQNSQAISQLYETPATNLNYEPFHNMEQPIQSSRNLNNQFQTFDENDGALINSGGIFDSRGFQGNLPSYASGILDRETLQDIKSLEKDRQIAELKQALVSSQGKGATSSTSARYAQNYENGNYIQSQSLLASQGELSPSIGPQLDRPSNNAQRPYGTTTTGIFLPVTGSPATGFTYGLPSTTPATQSSSTTAVTSTVSSSATQRPPQGVVSVGSSPVGTSASAPGTSVPFPFPQYGGFVPSLLGTSLITNYPTYATNFLGSSSSSISHVQSSSPTHFGIPIPALPASEGAFPPNNRPSSQKPEGSGSGHQQHLTPVQPIPIRPIQPIQPIQSTQPLQPIHPIPTTPVHTSFPIVPTVTHIHPVPAPVAPASGQPTYNVQPVVINPLLVKPIKAVYPVYYYPNAYQIQKPGAPVTLPWNYAPSYAQTKPAQIWK